MIRFLLKLLLISVFITTLSCSSATDERARCYVTDDCKSNETCINNRCTAGGNTTPESGKERSETTDKAAEKDETISDRESAVDEFFDSDNSSYDNEQTDTEIADDKNLENSIEPDESYPDTTQEDESGVSDSPEISSDADLSIDEDNPLLIEKCTITASTLNLRDGPGPEYDILAPYIVETELTILENLTDILCSDETNHWVKVKITANNAVGYMCKGYLDCHFVEE